jgi:serine protease AprX
VVEVRCEMPGPGFSYGEKVRIGTPLDDVLNIAGRPAKIIISKKVEDAQGVLYRDVDGKSGQCYYRPSRGVRFFFADDKVSGIFIMPEGIDAKIEQLAKPGTTAEQVVCALGEPRKYIWGNMMFSKTTLPKTYVMLYRNGVDIFIENGRVAELRSEGADPGFVWRGNLRIGSSLDDVLQTVGRPAETIEGKLRPPQFSPNILYKDINGQKGYCYYARPDRNLRFIFVDYRVSGLYVTPDGPQDNLDMKPAPESPLQSSSDDIDAKIAKLNKPNVTVEEVIQILGEPEKKVLPTEKNSLPETYSLIYPEGVSVFVRLGHVWELRSGDVPGSGFSYRGLRLGSSLDEALRTLGQPLKTVAGKENDLSPNVLHEDIDGQKGLCYYDRPDKNVRLFFGDYKISALYLTLYNMEGAASANDIDAKIAKLNKPRTTIEEVVRVLGEPEEYVWGNEAKHTTSDWKGLAAEKSHLPAAYCLIYPDNVRVFMLGGEVWELRCDEPGPGFKFGGLHLGSTLDEALQTLGPPSATSSDNPKIFEPDVLYKDIEGTKGRCYYSRPDKHVRMFFQDYKVGALYVTIDSQGLGQGSSRRLMPIKTIQEYDDVRVKDLSGIDLSAKPALPATLWFNQKTVWPKTLPAGVDPQKIMTDAMNPGLGVRDLHNEGLTGKGVNVAIIDQPLYHDHPEFAGKIAAYHDLDCGEESSMHGPAVASLLVGNKCGTAPDAKLYYVAAPSWTGDAGSFAKALDWIVEQNEKLPPSEKIRVVSVSAAPSGPGSPFKQNNDMWDPACQRAEKAGIMVLDCTSHHGFVGRCYYDATDPENVAKCKAGSPKDANGYRNGNLLVPCSVRTTAEEMGKGECSFQYCGVGGLSWSIPYCAGVLAMGWQIRPDLDAARMKDLLFKSAHKTTDGALIINPPEFIRMVKAADKSAAASAMPNAAGDVR